MSMSAETTGARMTGAVEGDAATTVHWLLSDLVERVAGARHALLLSSDGLLLSASEGVDREEAERLAAIASGFASLARGARSQLGAREVRQTVVEMDSVFFFVLSAGRRSEEHTSELQSRGHLVCRALLEKKNDE